MPRKNPKIRFDFDQGVESEWTSLISKKARANVRKLSELFPDAPPAITVHVFSNLAAFRKVIGKNKTSGWLIANVPSGSTSDIFLLHRQGHTNEIKKVDRIILHELAHLYTNILNPNLPDWMKEGISVYLAQQIYSLTIDGKDWKKLFVKGAPFGNISWRTATKYNGYNVAGLLVRFLVKTFGWQRVFNALDQGRLRDYSWKKMAANFNRNGEKLLMAFRNQHGNKSGVTG